mgnify:CR=1 FL=1
MANEKILVVDDDKNICELLRLYLVKEGYNVTMVHDGGAALAEFDKLHPDLVLLDVMMPVMDGWEVCRKIRAKDNTPIIMLTAKGETYDKVLGLELGADDYIVKPFDAKEVTARIKAVLRRSSAKEEENKGVYDFDNLHLDMNRYELKVKGKVVEAPPKELELLYHLASTPNRVYTRNQLLDETEKQARLLRGEIARTDSVAGNLSAKLERDRAQYGEMVREAYRNYKHNNYLTYIFSSRDFTDVARKITALREVASLRERKLRDIEALTAEVRTEKETLDRRKRSLDSVTRSLSAQREKLQRDARNAKASIRSMSQKEKTALQRKIAQEQQLDVAIGELRKLTKGNTEGASFSAKTSGLRLPVTAGRVKRYKENMAEITGPKGAHVISIYDGKVVDVKRNRITNKYDVYVAHGEYITSYANMGTICVEKGQKVARNAQIGTIGSAVNVMTMETEYKLVFGIYPPNPGQKMRAEECFRK